MRSRSPLLASRASRPTEALIRHDCENQRIDARELYDMLSIKGIGNRPAGRKAAIAVQVKSQSRARE